jgi:large subunit ribosomal protein L29
MKNSEIRQMSNEEINSNVAKLKEELFNLRFQLAVGQLTNTARIKQVKKAIARLKTVQSEKAGN